MAAGLPYDPSLPAMIAVMDALGDYVDARIHYAAGDPEWRSDRDVSRAADALGSALALWKAS